MLCRQAVGLAQRMNDVRTVLVIAEVYAGTFASEVTQISISYADLSARVLSQILPDLVVMPLFGAGFDAIEALAQLDRFGFRGDVVVRTPYLPNNRIVERELCALVPNLRVRLVGPAS